MASDSSDPRRDLTADPDDPAAAARLYAEARRTAAEDHFAIIACINGNLEALEAVFADIDRRAIPRIVCLGDIVGIGPNPVECVDLVFERCDWTLQGINDENLFGDDQTGMRDRQTEMIYQKFRPRWFSGRVERERLERLRQLPANATERGRQFAWGTWSDRYEEHRVIGSYERPRSENTQFYIWHDFAAIDHVLFCAGAGKPGSYQRVGVSEGESETLRSLTSADRPTLVLDRSVKTIVEVGSVGHPRDEDSRPCYVEVLGEFVKWHRVDYDIDKTLRKIRASKLDDPDWWVERLRKGI